MTRQAYRAGEKMLVDYAGDTLSLVDPKTGEVTPVYLFAATLGASDYTYVEPQRAQDLAAWIGGHARAFEYFRGVPRFLVPDNAKVAARHPDRYEPELNRTYQEMAEHDGAAIVPARPGRGRDKAKLEQMVQMAGRRVIAPLRHRTFFSSGDLEEAVAELGEASHAGRRYPRSLDPQRLPARDARGVDAEGEAGGVANTQDRPSETGQAARSQGGRIP